MTPTDPMSAMLNRAEVDAQAMTDEEVLSIILALDEVTSPTDIDWLVAEFRTRLRAQTVRPESLEINRPLIPVYRKLFHIPEPTP